MSMQLAVHRRQTSSSSLTNLEVSEAPTSSKSSHSLPESWIRSTSATRRSVSGSLSFQVTLPFSSTYGDTAINRTLRLPWQQCHTLVEVSTWLITKDTPWKHISLRQNPEGNPPWAAGRLASGPNLVGQIGSGVWVSVSFQIFALRMLLLLHSAELPPGIFSRGNIQGKYFRGSVMGNYLLWNSSNL